MICFITMHVKRSTLKKNRKKKHIVSCPAVKEGALFLRSVFRKPFKKKRINSAHFSLFWAMSVSVIFRKFSSKSTSLNQVKYAPFI